MHGLFYLFIYMKKTALILSLAFLVACNNSEDKPAETANTAAKPLVHLMPALDLVDAKGQPIQLSSFKGKKVFVNLWATWCPPCRAEMPSIQKLAAAVDSSKVAFVMLSLDEDFETARQYAEKTGLNLPIYGPAANLPPLFTTPGIPVTYIFNENGELVFRRDRAENYDQPQFVELLNK